MPNRLRLYFGGLCLLVEEKTGGAGAETGFYAVLPVNKDFTHKPTLYYKGRNTSAKHGDDWIQLDLPKNACIDLKRFVNAGPGGFPMPDRFLHVSRHAKASVDATCLVKAGGCVNALVQMPLLQRAVEPYGDIARLWVVGPGGVSREWVAGLAIVEYDIAGDSIGDPTNPVPVPEGALYADNGLIELTVANIPADHKAHDASMPPMSVGQEVTHQRCFYDLLKGPAGPSGANGITPPRFFIETAAPDNTWLTYPTPLVPPTDATRANPGGRESKTDQSASRHGSGTHGGPHSTSATVPADNRFVIVEECTVGLGCPPSSPDPDCS